MLGGRAWKEKNKGWVKEQHRRYRIKYAGRIKAKQKERSLRKRERAAGLKFRGDRPGKGLGDHPLRIDREPSRLDLSDLVLGGLVRRRDPAIGEDASHSDLALIGIVSRYVECIGSCSNPIFDPG